VIKVVSEVAGTILTAKSAIDAVKKPKGIPPEVISDEEAAKLGQRPNYDASQVDYAQGMSNYLSALRMSSPSYVSRYKPKIEAGYKRYHDKFTRRQENQQ